MEANTTTKHIIRSSLWIMFFFAMSRVTGLVKIITTSSQFGTGGDADAFTAANQIPELFTIMISGGAFSAALIPVYSQYVLGKDKQSQEGLANTALTIVFGSLSLLALLGILFAPVMTSTFLMRGADPAVQQLTAELIRILLISMVIVGVSGVFGAILNANQHFISPAISTVTIDLGHIAGLVFLAPVFGIKGVAYGSVIGAACHLLVQVPALIRYGIGFMPQLGLQLQATRQMLRLLIPRMVMLGTQQLIDIWLISLSSTLPEGAISAYFYAQLGMQIPTALFSQSVVIPLFPTMCAYFNEGKVEKLRHISGKTLHIILFLVAPSSLAILIFGRPAIRLIMERGEFDASSTIMVSTILGIFTIRMVALALIELFEKLFFARQNTISPIRAYLAWLVIHGVLAYFLVQSYGIYGIAWSSSIATAVMAIWLMVENRMHLPNWPDKQNLQGIMRVVATTGLTGAIAYLLPISNKLGWVSFISWNSIGLVVYLVIYILLGGRHDLQMWGRKLR